jgi:hypothetical protein
MKCTYCGADLIEKTRSRGYKVFGCRRGCPSYQTIDEETGLPLAVSGSAANHAARQSSAITPMFTAQN